MVHSHKRHSVFDVFPDTEKAGSEVASERHKYNVTPVNHLKDEPTTPVLRRGKEINEEAIHTPFGDIHQRDQWGSTYRRMFRLFPDDDLAKLSAAAKPRNSRYVSTPGTPAQKVAKSISDPGMDYGIPERVRTPPVRRTTSGTINQKPITDYSNPRAPRNSVAVDAETPTEVANLNPTPIIAERRRSSAAPSQGSLPEAVVVSEVRNRRPSAASIPVPAPREHRPPDVYLPLGEEHQYAPVYTKLLSTQGAPSHTTPQMRSVATYTTPSLRPTAVAPAIYSFLKDLDLDSEQPAHPPAMSRSTLWRCADGKKVALLQCDEIVQLLEWGEEPSWERDGHQKERDQQNQRSQGVHRTSDTHWTQRPNGGNGGSHTHRELSERRGSQRSNGTLVDQNNNWNRGQPNQDYAVNQSVMYQNVGDQKDDVTSGRYPVHRTLSSAYDTVPRERLPSTQARRDSLQRADCECAPPEPLPSQTITHDFGERRQSHHSSVNTDLLLLVEEKIRHQVEIDWPELFLLKNAHCLAVLPLEKRLRAATRCNLDHNSTALEQLRTAVHNEYDRYESLLHAARIAPSSTYTRIAHRIMLADAAWFHARITVEPAARAERFRAAIGHYTVLLEEAEAALNADAVALLSLLQRVTSLLAESANFDPELVMRASLLADKAERRLERRSCAEAARRIRAIRGNLDRVNDECRKHLV